MSSPWRWAAAGIAIIPCLLLWEAVTGRAVLYERDILAYWVPGVEAFVRAVAEGAWPLWEPYTNFGRPMLADPSMQIAYPPTWLNLVLSPGTYYTWFVVAHAAWAGIGALRLGRAWGLQLPGAAWGAAAFMLSGPFLSLASLYHHYASASWMGWVLLALEGVLVAPGASSAAWLGLAAAGMALAGSADICVMTGAACAARLVFAAARERALVTRTRLGAVVAAGALAAMLSGVQWWATLAHVAVGSRGATGARASMYWSTHPASLVDIVAPLLVSELPLAPEARESLFESRSPLLRSLYAGVPVLIFATCALAAGRWRFRWLAAALAGLFLLAALGRFTPFYPAIVGWPIVRLLRFPVKYMVPASFFVAMLSGAGVDAVRHHWDARTRRLMIGVTVAAALAMITAAGISIGAERVAARLLPGLDSRLAGDVPERIRGCAGRAAVLAAVAAGSLLLRMRRPASALLAMPVALFAADLFLAGRATMRLAPPELLRHRPPLLDAFPRPSEHRLHALVYGVQLLNRQFTPPARWDPEWAWALGNLERLSPPMPTRFGIAGSFDGDFTGLTPLSLTRLTAAVNAAPRDPASLRLLQMAAVTDVVGFEDAFAGRPARAERLSVYAGPVRVFAVPDPLPRAYFVEGVRADNPPAEDSVVLAADFDARREVALSPAAGRPASPPAAPAGVARIVARRSDRVTIMVAAERAGVLVLTEAYDPGWRAWVDGAPAPVWRANAIFRGVPVGKGDHVVEMRYRPPSVAWGAAASALGVALATGLIGRRAR